jgi:hypothetical protein
MSTNQPGPHIPSNTIASQLERPRNEPKTLKKEHLEAKPGPAIPDKEQIAAMGTPKSKAELQKEAEKMNKSTAD